MQSLAAQSFRWATRAIPHRLVVRCASSSSAVQAPLQVGKLYTGVVTSVSQFGANVDIEGQQAWLAVSKISSSRIPDLPAANLLAPQEAIKVVLISQRKDRRLVSTKALELEPGQMLTNKQAVFDNAEAALVVYTAKKQAELAARKQRLSELQVGTLVTGVVLGKQDQGSLVDLGNVSVLVKRSNENGPLAKGDQVKVLITHISLEENRADATCRYVEDTQTGTYKALPPRRSTRSQPADSAAPAALST